MEPDVAAGIATFDEVVAAVGLADQGKLPLECPSFLQLVRTCGTTSDTGEGPSRLGAQSMIRTYAGSGEGQDGDSICAEGMPRPGELHRLVTHLASCVRLGGPWLKPTESGAHGHGFGAQEQAGDRMRSSHEHGSGLVMSGDADADAGMSSAAKNRRRPGPRMLGMSSPLSPLRSSVRRAHKDVKAAASSGHGASDDASSGPGLFRSIDFAQGGL